MPLRYRLCCTLLLIASLVQAQQLDTTRLGGLRARSIGPAGMSGRVTAIDVDLRDPDVLYVGTASGGLWKSTSGGVAWTPLFDRQPVASIGAVAVDPRNPDVIWVGTGEGNPRNSQNAGAGVFKSLDAGRTWQFMGLPQSRAIHRLLIDPHDSDVVYAGVQGPAWGETTERGVFKTTDGGRTWRQVLYADPKTGIADLVMDPQNPNKLIAAMWTFHRWPWFFQSGGSGSGLFISHDGGETWTKRTDKDGLPAGELGRIGLAIAHSSPNVVYALVEAKKNGLYRSDDGGRTFTLVNSTSGITNRPFYYNDLRVDPANENRLYHVASTVRLSEDGGKTFSTFLPWERVHPDHHAWWIHPHDPTYIIEGNDGGLAISHDRGRTWRFVENLPLGQFYHIGVDLATPYHVYGGMQDNGSWKGPSSVWRNGGIRNSYWEEVAFGDGFDVLPDPANDRYLYAMSQGGYLVRSDLATGLQKLIRPTHPDGVPLRFNWNAGLAQDPFDPHTIYYGSQFVHRSTDRGNTWTVLSPDLTTNDPTKQRQRESGGLTFDVTSAENHTTILTIAPSPRQRGVLWVGTDDGNVQLTRDGGQTWTNVKSRIRGVPAQTWVPQIRTSVHDPAEAFVVFDDHRRNNWEAYVYHTRDYGQTWERLVDCRKLVTGQTPGEVCGFALAIEQDPVEPKLLFLGTEVGLYVSLDAGATWTKWTNGVPTVPVIDLVIHPREHDLVIGTFGRAAFILDDIRPLREMARTGVATLSQRPLHVFDPGDAVLAVYREATGTRFAAEAMFSGENRPYGALFTYHLLPPDTSQAAPADTTQPKTDKVKLEIVDGSGAVIRTLQGPAKPGLNRLVWRLDRRGVRQPGSPKPKPDAAEPGGPLVLPGTYTVRVQYGLHRDSTTVTVRMDPRLTEQEASLRLRDEYVRRWMQHTGTATAATDRLQEAKETIELIGQQLGERTDTTAQALKKHGGTMQDSLRTLRELFVEKEAQGITDAPDVVAARLSLASAYLTSSFDPPGQADDVALHQAEQSLEAALARVNAFFATTWPTYRQAVEAAQLEWFKPWAPLQMQGQEP
jgi:photosystem II stability/assembly factor-like uncharacterized protein